MSFKSVLDFAKQITGDVVRSGDVVVDATVGNGNDTLFLANLVGANGFVYGFDIQQAALDSAASTLQQNDDSAKNQRFPVQLLLQNHAEMEQHIKPEHHGQIAAVMFNLGYLPGGLHDKITTASSTIPALEAAFRLLRVGGMITVVIYSGHPGGQEEAEEVHRWAQQLPQQSAQVLKYQFMNQANNPPYLIAIRKKC